MRIKRRDWVSYLVSALPLLSALSVLVLASVFSYEVLKGKTSDRQVIDWTFFLLTGFVLTAFLDQISSRIGKGSDFLSLSEYETLAKAGLSEPDSGLQRVQKQWERLNTARDEVLQIGTAFSNMCDEENVELWQDLATKKRVCVMMLDPDWLQENPAVLDRIADHLLREPDILLRQIRKSLSNLERAANTLLDRDNLQVRVFQGFPSLNYTLVDHDRSNARLILELLPYHCGFRNRLQVVVRSTPDGWYSTLAKLARQQWSSGKQIYPPLGPVDTALPPNPSPPADR